LWKLSDSQKALTGLTRFCESICQNQLHCHHVTAAARALINIYLLAAINLIFILAEKSFRWLLATRWLLSWRVGGAG